ncbi:hypothetical protein OROGR_031051 [Orobanche gracilis]
MAAQDGSREPSVTLRSSDLQDFSIPKSAAVLSATIKKMLKEDSPDEIVIPLHKVDGGTLASVVTYLNDARAAASEQSVTSSGNDKGKKPDGKFLSDKKMKILIDVVLAAHNLGIPDLVDTVSEMIAGRIKNKSVEWARKVFALKNDITAAEVADVRSQYPWAWEGVEPDSDYDDSSSSPSPSSSSSSSSTSSDDYIYFDRFSRKF